MSRPQRPGTDSNGVESYKLVDAIEPALIDVRAVSVMLSCSWRHVYRMADAGRMPSPIRFGSLVRWRKSDIERWLAEGCPSVKRGKP
jgi:excisionase family DNA binding protein